MNDPDLSQPAPAVITPGGPLRSGAILARTANLWMRNALALLAAGAAASLPLSLFPPSAEPGLAGVLSRLRFWESSQAAAELGVSLLASAFVAAAATHAMFSALAGRPVLLWRAAAFAWRRLIPALVAVLAFRILQAACVAPLVTGLWLDEAWLVGLGIALLPPLIALVLVRAMMLVPVAVLEPAGGVTGALRRAWQLSAGTDTFLCLLGVLLLALAAGLGVALLLLTLSTLLFSTEAEGLPFAAMLFGLWYSTFLPSLAAVTYHELRVAREGGDAAEMLDCAAE